MPVLVPSESWSPLATGQFATSGVKVRITAYNRVMGRRWFLPIYGIIPLPPLPDPFAGPTKDPRPFKILVDFEATDRDLTFDPARVTLASDTISPMHPVALLDSDGLPYSLVDHHSVELTFDVDPPDPKRSFTLTLDGFMRGDTPVPPLRVWFTPWSMP
jgi:hypothetical protein